MSDLYLDSLSLQEEMPRLAAQSRLVYLGLEEFLRSHPIPIKNEGSLLDVGSGLGILTALVSRHFPGIHVTGLDKSTDMIRFAQVSNPKMEWVNGDVASLPFSDASFDILLNSFFLIHLPQLEKSLKEMDRVLRPGGYILMIEPDQQATKVDPLIEKLIHSHGELGPGDRKALTQAESFYLGKAYEMITQQELIITTDGSDDAPELNYPNIKIGRMTAWSMISHMGQLMNLRDIYNECLESYMKKEISIQQFVVSIRLYRKKA
ncbi:class I SAM-dependent methyltransferase [Leptospira sp. GIMC2001]|uniref:class I SAM-dependent methyltransferase n=1 Tax=Leptospira sp. GIMC2001 TaxID=1513297 RepID=UPI00234A0A63|nr:class I SAM-dependent methyltransferase [Leptospira sp. GIMC2001]WCL50317.1 class I SAM-dependent methyltransferase [Leptospira sp. GIMC2001]